jgi:hypothetical protein
MNMYVLRNSNLFEYPNICYTQLMNFLFSIFKKMKMYIKMIRIFSHWFTLLLEIEVSKESNACLHVLEC